MLQQHLDLLITEKLLKGIDIPPQPHILQLIMSEQKKIDPDLRKIANEVSKDVAISAAMLRAVNSPLFGLSKKLTSISQAVMLLGLRNSINLITGLSLRSSMMKNSKINLNRFWIAATDTALICSALARRFKIMSADEAHLLGLFHNCGIPLMMQKFTSYAEKLTKLDPQAEELIVDLEEELFNTNHALVGFLVARSWGLPEQIRLAILNHHEESLIKEAKNDLLTNQVAMLTLSEHLCNIYHLENEDITWIRVGNYITEFFSLNEEDLKDLSEDMKDMLAAS